MLLTESGIKAASEQAYRERQSREKLQDIIDAIIDDKEQLEDVLLSEFADSEAFWSVMHSMLQSYLFSPTSSLDIWAKPMAELMKDGVEEKARLQHEKQQLNGY